MKQSITACELFGLANHPPNILDSVFKLNLLLQLLKAFTECG